MEVTFFGVRGSIPVSGEAFAAYGGHTSSYEVLCDDIQIVIDAGSGFQNIKLREDIPVLILLSHFHHDHIQGFTFNNSVFSHQKNIFLSSALCAPDQLRDTLRTYFSGGYFPVDAVNMLSHLRFVEFNKISEIVDAEIEIESIPLNHPGGCVGYSLTSGTKKFTYLQDNEFEDSQNAPLGAFIEDSDLVVWDGMFTEAELPERAGWGHSSLEQGVAFAKDHQVRCLAIAHHAPFRTDAMIKNFEDEYGTDQIIMARENQRIIL